MTGVSIAGCVSSIRVCWTFWRSPVCLLDDKVAIRLCRSTFHLPNILEFGLKRTRTDSILILIAFLFSVANSLEFEAKRNFSRSEELSLGFPLLLLPEEYLDSSKSSLHIGGYVLSSPKNLTSVGTPPNPTP